MTIPTLVERLRANAKFLHLAGRIGESLLENEAADEIEWLKAEHEALKDALVVVANQAIAELVRVTKLAAHWETLANTVELGQENDQRELASTAAELARTQKALAITLHGPTALAELAALTAERDAANTAFEQEHQACRNLTEKVIPNLREERDALRADAERLNQELQACRQNR